jgi:predicted metal-dependent hydrolase
VNTQPEYIQQQGFVAEIVRTDRIKSADIRVEEGAVSVVVPKQLSEDKITQLLKAKRKWIKEKITLHQEANPVSTKQYVSGESFSYLGRNYRLKVIDATFEPVKLIQGRLVISVPSGQEQAHMVRNALVRWYKHHAELKLNEKVKRLSVAVGVEPTGVGIKTFKSRWGSCSAKGKIDINWKIIMAPNRIVDYVVVHELCHLIHYDHSPKFWREVDRVMPSYLESKDWLKVNGSRFE